jgi:hypothetical protein
MKGLYAVLLATVMLVGFGGEAAADIPPVEIFYTLTNPGGGATWEYDYTVVNHTLVDSWGGVSWFNVYFPAVFDVTHNYVGSDYSNLQAVLPLPTNWEIAGSVVQPGNPFPIFDYRGVYGASAIPQLASSSKIAPGGDTGNSLSGFCVTFNYAGVGAPPGPQQFQIIDLQLSDNSTGWSEILFTGTTQLDPVPEPLSASMLALGLLSLVFVRRKR